MMKVKLNNGYEMPIVGLGTWRSSPEDAYQACLLYTSDAADE